MKIAFTLIATAVLTGSLACAQKPDLHGGGAQPSEIENHKTTKVTLPGYHLAGATLTVDGACRLESYTAAENQIVMSVAGNRAASDHDGTCYLHVKNAAGSASTWIVVDLTEEETSQLNAGTARRSERRRRSLWRGRAASGRCTSRTAGRLCIS